ncbi:hypothetical protein UFOVP398_62 [uncultured Caudovirales phage]|uniref:Uncharacterized protein n=1 Tax=uncultured Caudovirales phage TaxID=2100421 RepID=A0A6J5M150_9CAUD|nr:hypothetical protein UFOVP398_62 [uncultured Caudovirales phage]
MKHTPGPWLHPQGLALSRHKAGKPIDYEIPVTAGDRPIAFVSHYCAEESATARITERNRMEMQEANARLIAAAPDLLEALKLWQELWDNDNFVSGSVKASNERAKVLSMTAAAIRKAEEGK